jgi:hypothetical protein
MNVSTEFQAGADVVKACMKSPGIVGLPPLFNERLKALRDGGDVQALTDELEGMAGQVVWYLQLYALAHQGK